MQAEAKPQSKIVKYGGGFLGVTFVLSLVAFVAMPKSQTPPAIQATPTVQANPAPAAPVIAPGVPISDFQKTFTAVVEDAKAKYRATTNELARSAIVTERNARFEKLKGSPRKITDWVGRIEHMGTTGAGKAYISITLADSLTVTTNYADFADTQDRTLIPQTSPIYKKMVAMKEGDLVKFSGQLKRQIDVTEAGKILDPNFLFVFSDISKIQS